MCTSAYAIGSKVRKDEVLVICNPYTKSEQHMYIDMFFSPRDNGVLRYMLKKIPPFLNSHSLIW